MKKSHLIFLLLPLIWVGCDEGDENDSDLTPPVIQSVMINDSDHDIVVEAGDEMHVDVELSDNEELRELKIDMHDAFDGHGHNKQAPWSQVMIIPLSGKTQTLHEHFDVPAMATAGMYHGIFRALDQEGNESDFVEVNFVVTNGTEPQIEITAPDFGQEVHVNKGSALELRGSITDERDLAEVKVVIEEAHDHDHGHHHKKDGEGPLVEVDIDLDGSGDLTFDLSSLNINIPADAETAHYDMQIVAKDADGNYGIFKGELHIM